MYCSKVNGFALNMSEVAEVGGTYVRAFILSSSSAVGSRFTKNLASVRDFGHIGRKFEVVFFFTSLVF